MARKIATVTAPKPGQGATLDVPEDVKQEVEDLYATLRDNSDQEGMAEFDTVDERNTWIRQVRAYTKHRQAGALKFRQLPSKHLPDTQIRFQITADLPENGAREGKK